MKQNRILLNNAGRNHIKVFPMKDIEGVPVTELDRYHWMEQVFSNLLNSSDAHNLYMQSNKRKGYLIAVWELDGIYYLIMSLRTNKGIFNNVLYMSHNENDMIAIAKFLVNNIEEVGRSFKASIEKMEELVDEISKRDNPGSEDMQEDIQA